MTDELTKRMRELRKELSRRKGYNLARALQRKYFSQNKYKTYSVEEVIQDLGRCLAVGMDFELLGMVVWYINTANNELNEATWKARKLFARIGY